ncbi:hypothetical protein AB833_18265 [Chromatiales bacterium (ex Bugula neritina AB1)]|nr:hypothetical protein AB833_18265 [Chromatiales bacterium (ex Bugula neritina AB1)]
MSRANVIAIWDQWIRLFHWSLVIAIAVLLITGETGVGFYDWHRLAGEWVLGLVVFRLLWGLAGSSNAKVAALVRPLKAFDHLKQLARGRVEPERGHNAAGGFAVLIMLLLIGIQAVSGSFIADEDELIEGAFYGVLSSDTTDWLYTVHTTNAVLLEVMIAIHIFAVMVYLLYAKHNLITAMITGKMPWPEGRAVPEIKLQPFGRGLLVACVVAVALVLILR